MDQETSVEVTAQFPDGNSPARATGEMPRRVLATWVASAENPYLARTLVNRYGAKFFGGALVSPFESANDPGNRGESAVLDYLAKEFALHGFDLKFLIRVLTLSESYQRTSRLTHASQQDGVRFARMPVRSLSGDQLFDSLVRVSGLVPHRFPLPREPRTGNSFEAFREKFVAPFPAPNPGDDNDPTILATLFLMNGPAFEHFAREGCKQSLDAIATQPGNTAYGDNGFSAAGGHVRSLIR